MKLSEDTEADEMNEEFGNVVNAAIERKTGVRAGGGRKREGKRW